MIPLHDKRASINPDYSGYAASEIASCISKINELVNSLHQRLEKLEKEELMKHDARIEALENQYVGERIIDEHLARTSLLDELLEEVRGKRTSGYAPNGIDRWNSALSEVEQILLKKKVAPQ